MAGGVVAWGGNQSGQLGIGNNQNVPVAEVVQIPDGTIITAIAAGDAHSLALTSTGRVLAWGSNGEGELGNPTAGPTSDLPVEVALPQGVNVIAIAAGGEHSLAVTSTGGMFAWGSNGFGELGIGTSGSPHSTPVAVHLPAGTAVTSAAAGESHSVARTATGRVLAWGSNEMNQLGNGTSDDADVPVPVALPAGTTVTAVASGAFANHTLAVTSAGNVLAWGSNTNGQLGIGNTISPDFPTQTLLPAGTTATTVAAGADHSVAGTATGGALAWGDNSAGEAGNGTTSDAVQTPVPVSLPGNTILTDVAAGGSHDLAVASPSAVPGPDTGDGTAAATGAGRGTILGAGLLALALAVGVASAIRSGRRHRTAPARAPGSQTT
ncbi:RCC1 domain-containing protein [Actinopolymorpha pittospori]|uniref:Alpha-tubulin suppressor-like RCC1 family protein n=1 Tax=Actinopolymorpha pittospori TaxID=648752 RepID=A0A927MSG7_9ACTN|nr:chromosome condensation regulator RCC1 [Actinopolymorpha pittospori]MBE1605501.1 alpha-tubulin suppressor-like RCC1 family protein [Actinopolymorpha pittospori]